MYQTDEGHHRSTQTMEKVSKSIREYALVKTGTNLATAVLCLLVLWATGQDFALFWGFLIFLLNFIPTFGSILAVGLPAMFALLQFEGWAPVAIVLVGISLAHGLIGYLLEPRLMGRTLNISPLVILISLSIWGSIWGVVGMILAVPIMVALMIVLAAIPAGRPIAVWMSADGLTHEA
jgi:predicted PurR-regulated permease PerM